MFKDFLKIHIQDLIEYSDDKYEMTKEDIEEVACRLNNDDHLWCDIDSYIFDELYQFKKEEEE